MRITSHNVRISSQLIYLDQDIYKFVGIFNSKKLYIQYSHNGATMIFSSFYKKYITIIFVKFLTMTIYNVMSNSSHG